MILGWDSETAKIQPGLLAPPPVVFSFSTTEQKWLAKPDHAAEFLEAELRNPDTIHVLHNGPFDWCVLGAAYPHLLPLIFQVHEEGRVRDTKIRQELLDIRSGRIQQHGHTLVARWTPEGEKWLKADYSLVGLEKLHLGRDRSAEKGEDAWRLRYASLAHLPLHEWPAEAANYPLDDAEGTRLVYEAQIRAAGDYLDGDALVNEREQVYAAFCLQLISCWGMRSDPVAVAALEERTAEAYAALRKKMLDEGLLRPERATAEHVREGKVDYHGPRIRKANKKHPAEFEVDGVGYYYEPDSSVAYRYVKDQAAVRERVRAAYEAKGEPVPMTAATERAPQGQIKIDADALENSGDELLEELSGAGTVASTRNVFLPVLKRGTEVPINTRFQPLLNTGRISSYEPNLNNLPRSGGVRECFVAREGFVFCSVDYDCAEIRSHAQINYWLFGASDQATFFQTDPHGDPHLELAASILGISVEEAKRRKSEGDKQIKEIRQASKALNFGLPGGMGWRKLKESARKGYGVFFTDDEARLRVQQWKDRWREMPLYMDWISQRYGQGEGDLEQLRYVDGRRVRHRIRGRVGYSDGANTLFQGLTADAAKHALTQVSKECYVVEDSPLYGSRPVAFLYDEIITEVPIDVAHEAAHRQAEIMCAAAQEWIPDVPITASPALMKKWFKGAEPVYVDGRLQPWEPSSHA